MGETILADATDSKSQLYEDLPNVVGFNVNIPILLDFKEKLDPFSTKTYLHSTTTIKLEHNDYKLLREGIEMEKSISNIFLAKITIHMFGLLNYLV